MRADRSLFSHILTASVLLLTGCVSYSDPIQTGENTYVITSRARGGFSSNGKLESDIIQKARDYCTAQGLKASLEQAGASGVQGWTPQDTKVAFKCLPSCDQLFADPALDPVRQKIALGSVQDQTVVMRADNSKPTAAEKTAIALWDEKRHECHAGEPSGIEQRTIPVAGAILANSHEDTEQLIAELYSGQITYGQFAAGRSSVLEQAETGTAQAMVNQQIQNTTTTATLTSANAQARAAQAQQQSAIAQQTEANAMQRLSQRPVINPSTSFTCHTIGSTTSCQ